MMSPRSPQLSKNVDNDDPILHVIIPNTYLLVGKLRFEPIPLVSSLHLITTHSKEYMVTILSEIHSKIKVTYE